jgi:hypothetical protein
MPDGWYYATPEEQVGPITLEELKETLPTLPNAKDVYIWHHSLPEWIRAGDLAEIVARASPRPLEADTSDNSDSDLVAHDAATDTKQRLLSLDEFHPDRTYSITMAPSGAEETGTTARASKPYSVVGPLVGAVLVLLGCGLVYLGFIRVLPRATGAFAVTGAILFIVGLMVILFTRRKATAE